MSAMSFRVTILCPAFSFAFRFIISHIPVTLMDRGEKPMRC
jgi:hypothetical protein